MAHITLCVVDVILLDKYIKEDTVSVKTSLRQFVEN